MVLFKWCLSKKFYLAAIITLISVLVFNWANLTFRRSPWHPQLQPLTVFSQATEPSTPSLALLVEPLPATLCPRIVQQATQDSPKQPKAVTEPTIPTPEVDPETPNPLPTSLQGNLRVSNCTERPIRLIALAQQVTETDETPDPYREPNHWDFVPEEGSIGGLILALPEMALRLQPGDVLVAFAQDGSRRYWGPYVVGKTDFPNWNEQKAEWRLVISP